jgi:uncharacterized protein YcnI
MRFLSCSLALILSALPARAQVAIDPMTTTPAAWERFGLRIINQTDTPTVMVRVEVPSAAMVLGVERKAGWTFETSQLPDSGPTVITWRGGSVERGEFGDFPFLARLKADARQQDLVFPVRIERANGSVVEWRGRQGQDYAAPRVQVAGTVRVSPTGSLMLASLAMGLAIVALIVAIARGAQRRS